MAEDEPKTPANDNGGEEEKARSAWVQVARYSHLAFALPAGTVVGWLMGAALDSWLGTKWINLVGLVLGIIAGFVELIRGALSLKDEK
ncbi:MAG: AtpZ/AtpI family protein [Terriglobales bacterium]